MIKKQLAIGNIVRRVLHLIREEAQTEKSDSEADSNDLGLPGKADGKQDLMKSQVWKLCAALCVLPQLEA
eukprot:1139176-Pelagomonas_calceolata.AAC.5